MNTKKSSEVLHETTRKIYEKQHERIARNDEQFERISRSYSAENFHIEPDWFQGKTVLDAGCGNFGALTVRLAELGCKKIYACDIGMDWIPKLTENLRLKGVPDSQFELRSGNVLDLPYADESFDFVAINGVFGHLQDTAEIELGFAEGTRLCKKGGYYFTSFGTSGGLMQGVIMPAVRKHYQNNEEFKKVIDNINPASFHSVIDKICEDSKKYGGEILDSACLKSLFSEDTCVFLQNFIQTPMWWTNECTPEYVEALYKKHEFENIKRLNEFVKRTDIRKFFAPLHYDWDHPISKVLYGHGYVKYIATK
ncbi:MAG: class I SAM-dependent methyltransferase [Candidatus Poseidoniia archaeon]|jgi:ubiquinone/menaquinone biosynthesis C-methylase UbiE|nr:class I SAM-dependent methyltransferase [Candidatus Poseidoniia archaeon]|tara:strand:+ start:262 stop:1191 length:930 start_codon:yes stop_codon:yes gene_type:complete